MDGLLEKALDLIKSLVTPEQGSKFLVTVLSIGGIVFLQWKQIGSWYAVIGIAAIAVAYFVFRLHEKGQLKNGGSNAVASNNGNGAPVNQ